MDVVYQFLAVIGGVFALAWLFAAAAQVGAYYYTTRAAAASARADLEELDTRDSLVRPAARGLAHYLDRPDVPGRVLYNPRTPCLQIGFRSTAHPVVMLFLDADGVPLGFAAADGPNHLAGNRPPELFTRAERRLLAEYVPRYLRELPTPSQAERVLRAITDDLAYEQGLTDAVDDYDAVDPFYDDDEPPEGVYVGD